MNKEELLKKIETYKKTLEDKANSLSKAQYKRISKAVYISREGFEYADTDKKKLINKTWVDYIRLSKGLFSLFPVKLNFKWAVIGQNFINRYNENELEFSSENINRSSEKIKGYDYDLQIFYIYDLQKILFAMEKMELILYLGSLESASYESNKKAKKEFLIAQEKARDFI